MKVLLVTEKLELGGAETLVVGLAGALAAAGVETALAAADGPLRARLDARVRFHRIARYSPARIPLVVRDLGEALRRFQPEAVHAHGVTVGVLCASAARLCRLKPRFVLTHHSRDTTRLPGAPAGRIMNLCFDRIIAISRSKRAGLEKAGLPAAKLALIPNFIDCAALEKRLSAIDKEEVRRELGLGPKDKAVVTAGRLIPSKRIDRFIAAVSRLKTAQPGRVVGLVLGDGPERARLETLARAVSGGARVRLLGYEPDVLKHLSVADIFYFPSEQEVLPMSLLEAQAAGVPAVALRIPGNDEIVEDGATGFLAEDDHQLQARLAELLADETMRDRMSREAARAARERFDVGEIVRRHLELYRA